MPALRLSAVILLAVLLTACGSTSEVPYKDGDAYLLQFRPSVGQVFDVEVSNTNDMQISVMGQQIPQKQMMSLTYLYAVEEGAEEGRFRITSTTERVKTQTEAMGQNLSFDSAEAGDRIPPAFRPFNALVGSSVTMTVGSDGTIHTIDGLSDLTQRVMDSIDMPNPEMNEQMRSQMEMTMGEDPMLENYRQAFRWYPEGPVAVGDSWEQSATTHAGFPMETARTLTLDRVEDSIAFISFTGDVVAEESEMDMGPVSMTMNISGSEEGSLQMDLRTGAILKMIQEISMSSSGTVSNPADPTQEMVMDMEGVSESTLTMALRE